MDGEIFVIEADPTAAAAQPTPAREAPLRHVCLDAWDGRTVRWSERGMVLGGEGFACVRRHYEALARKGVPRD